MEVRFLPLFLNLGERESDQNDYNDFEILFHFEKAVASE